MCTGSVLQKYRDAAMNELEALNTLAANDPDQDKHCVQLLEWFDYRWVGGAGQCRLVGCWRGRGTGSQCPSPAPDTQVGGVQCTAVVCSLHGSAQVLGGTPAPTHLCCTGALY